MYLAPSKFWCMASALGKKTLEVRNRFSSREFEFTFLIALSANVNRIK